MPVETWGGGSVIKNNKFNSFLLHGKLDNHAPCLGYMIHMNVKLIQIF